MSRTLDELATDYERAELTVLWLHDHASNQHQLLYAVAELCPVEQPSSPPLENLVGGVTHSMRRAALENARSLYVTRLALDSVGDAIAFFRGTGGRRIRIPAPKGGRGAVKPSEPIVLESPATLLDEPPNECPLLVSGNHRSLIEVLPRRSTQLRLLSRFDSEAKSQQGLTSRDLAAVQRFAREQLGVDLALYPEHFGAIHLCFSNPLIRNFEERLTSDERELLFEAHLRRGKTLDGCVVELIDERSGGAGFHVRHELKDRVAIIPLPAPPEKLRTLLFEAGPEGACLADEAAFFIRRFGLNMEMSGTTKRRLNLTRPDGSVERREIDVVTAEQKSIGEIRPSPSQLLAESERRRALQALRQDGTFYYFPGGPASRDEAREVLRTKFQDVRDRCLICDTYLSGQDVAEFVPFIRRARLNVRLLASAYFLLDPVVKGEPRTQGEALKEVIDELHRQDPTMQITCRVLRGRDKSPIHDRYLVLDDEVYLAGSSLNEFGRRATTLFRAPDPELLRGNLEWWWDERQKRSVSLDEFLAARSELELEEPES